MRIIFLIIFLCQLRFSHGQQFLQIERINSSETIKIGVGSQLIFKASGYSDQWQFGTIKEIIYKGQTIVFDHTFLTVDEISKIKFRNTAGESIAWALKGFGLSWLVFGAIADIANLNEENNLDAKNLAIGGFALGTGILLDKVSGNKIYTNNRTHRFRIVDLRFDVKEE
jgi:hypothetical protein